MCKLKPDDSKAWVLAADPENKKIEALSLFSTERMFYFEPTYIPCSFSGYLGAVTRANHLAGSLAELSCKPLISYMGEIAPNGNYNVQEMPC
jgi:hypothetical protein